MMIPPSAEWVKIVVPRPNTVNVPLVEKIKNLLERCQQATPLD
jgi:hypothetical protein